MQHVIDALRAGPPTLDVTPVANLLGVSRSGLHAAIAAGTAPVRAIRVGHRVKVITASVIEVLQHSDAVRTGETSEQTRRSEGMGEGLTTSGVKCDAMPARAG